MISNSYVKDSKYINYKEKNPTIILKYIKKGYNKIIIF